MPRKKKTTRTKKQELLRKTTKYTASTRQEHSNRNQEKRKVICDGRRAGKGRGEIQKCTAAILEEATTKVT